MAVDVERLRAALSGRYQIERPLGEGGMAVVYLARDLRHDRPVAVKVLRPELAASLGPEPFLREIRLTARLQHPHILPLLDSGDADGLLYYVMPFVAGESLRQRLAREGALPLDEALRITREIADALDYAHRHDVVHRDLKPENILLEEQHAVIADFGIARAVHAAGGETLAATGTLLGTPAYLSPEQAVGGSVDGRGDLYSLGCILYELLTGVPPFAGTSAESLVHQHLSVTPRSVTELRPSVPASLAQVVQTTLAKSPADRFATAARLVEALGTPVAITHVEVATVAPPRPRRRRNARVAAVALVVVVAGALAAWKGGAFTRFFPPTAGARGTPDWILVADFEGPADDSSLAVATRDLVSAALDQSDVVATVPREQIRLALEGAGRPVTSRLVPELAHELAYRRSVRAVVEGQIRRIGAGYAIVLRVVDTDSSRLVLAIDEVAESEQQLIPTVEQIARRLRAGLGERRADLRATRPLMEVTTPSFEAYRRFVRARELMVEVGDHGGAIAMARSAIALDPDFEWAWGTMGFCFRNRGEPDSALMAFREALRRPTRLDETRRYLYESAVADMNGDLPASLAACERALQLRPGHASAHNSMGVILSSLGRNEEALASLRRAGEVSAFGPTRLILSNQFWMLVTLGRLDEAQQVAGRLIGDRAREAVMVLALAKPDWAAAESLGLAMIDHADAARWIRRYGQIVSATSQAARGRVEAADLSMRRWQRNLEGDAQPPGVDIARLYRLLLQTVSGQGDALPADLGAPDSTAIAMIVRGLWEAAYGDTVAARRLLAAVRATPARDLAWQSSGPRLLEGWIASRQGRWSAALDLLLPAARRGDDVGFHLKSYRVFNCWLVADAYEHLGQPDSAATYFELAIEPGGRGSLLDGRIASSFGHRRLVLLYARLGRIEDARRHWSILAETVVRPDPEFRTGLEQAHAAIASAEAMASGAGERVRSP